MGSAALRYFKMIKMEVKKLKSRDKFVVFEFKIEIETILTNSLVFLFLFMPKFDSELRGSIPTTSLTNKYQSHFKSRDFIPSKK